MTPDTHTSDQGAQQRGEHVNRMHGLLVALIAAGATIGAAIIGARWSGDGESEDPPPNTTTIPAEQPGIRAQITSPADDEAVDYPIVLTGELGGELGGSELYAVVKQQPGGSYKPVKDACEISAGTDIRCHEIYLGAPDAHGVGFELLLVTADLAAQRAFAEYAARPPEDVSEGLEQLPDGVEIADRVTVVRE